jgi:predicted Zn-dependent protease
VDAVESDDPDAPLILDTLSRVYMRRLRLKPALACLNRWAELQPGAARPYHWRGWVLERLNHPKQARADYERALELDASLFPVRLRVAEMLLEDHRGAEARPHLERLRREAPDDPMVLARLGTCQLLLGRPKEARQLMEAAIAHLPDDYALQIDLAKLDVQEGRGVEAERRLRKVLRDSPAETEALHNLAVALQLQGRTDEALAAAKEQERYKALVERSNKLLQEVVDSPTAGADDYAETGRLLILRGNEQLGVYWLEQALGRDSSHQAAHRALAEYYEKKGDREQAASHRRWLRAAKSP